MIANFDFARLGVAVRNQLALIILVIYLCLILFGVKSFTVWPQIEYAHQAFLGLVADERPVLDQWVHAPRYALMAPIIGLSDLTGVPSNTLFGCVVLTLAVLTWRIVRQAAMANIERIHHVDIALLVLILAMLYLMNGRMVFTLFSSALLLHIDARCTAGSQESNSYLPLLYLMAIWCASVSSGGYLALMGVSVIWLVAILPQSICASRVARFLHLLFVLSLPLLVLMVVKILDYYSSDLMGILQHGLGHNLWLLVIGLLLAPLLVMKLYKMRRNDQAFLWLIVVMGMLGGLLGYASLVFSMPAVLVIITRWYIQKRGLNLVGRLTVK